MEEALRLVEAHGGQVTVVTMGTEGSVDHIRKALALGAEKAILISDPALAGSDALGTAKALAAAIQKEQFDIVITATESTDSYSGLVPGQLAELLDFAPLTFANHVSVEDTTVTIERQTDNGYQVVEADLPVLISVTSGINEPRYPSLKGLMGAKRKEIVRYSAADLGLGPDQVGESAAREKVLTVGRPDPRGAGHVVIDDGEAGRQIAEFLAALGVLRP
jgi:electron transfer flavoprotein beta subunit